MRSGYLVNAVFVLAILFLQGTAFATDLYSDAWVDEVARTPIGPESTFDLSQQPYLDVVPRGQTLKIVKIFERLGIDPKRVISIGSYVEMNVTFFRWKISNTYLLSIMVGSQSVPSGLKSGEEWKLPGYGVRVFRITE
jgi:hypothetical protein